MTLPADITYTNGQPRSATSAGVPYITIAAGVKPEGEAPIDMFDDEDSAWKNFWFALQQYLEGEKASAVEFRIWPQVMRTDDDRVYIRARLAVTERRA